MRTTVNLDDDVLEAAKELARLKGQGLGRTLSELARRGLQPENNVRIEERDGIPTLVRDNPVTITPELVRKILDEGYP